MGEEGVVVGVWGLVAVGSGLSVGVRGGVAGWLSVGLGLVVGTRVGVGVAGGRLDAVGDDNGLGVEVSEATGRGVESQPDRPATTTNRVATLMTTLQAVPNEFSFSNLNKAISVAPH
jgi:hypothetical protein